MSDPRVTVVAVLGRLGTVYEIETARQVVQIRVTPSGLIRVGTARKRPRRKNRRAMSISHCGRSLLPLHSLRGRQRPPRKRDPPMTRRLSLKRITRRLATYGVTPVHAIRTRAGVEIEWSNGELAFYDSRRWSL